MDSSKWRISKACHECRVRKIRCDGHQPCERCKLRGLTCAYREKARDRARKPHGSVAPSTTPTGGAPHSARPAASMTDGDSEASPYSATPGRERGIHNLNQSVAATHRAPATGHVLQLYYGPTSNFSLMHAIYHQVEGTRPNSPSRDDVQEVGPDLDLFSHRRLFFGDLADAQEAPIGANDTSAIFLDPPTSRAYLDKFLASYWNGLPVKPKKEWRKLLNDRFASPAVLNFESHEDISMTLALAIGAHISDEAEISDYLFQKARKAAAMLDDVVNIHVVHIYILIISIPLSYLTKPRLTSGHGHLQLERARPNSAYLHLGTATRKAVAAGLHKEVASSTTAAGQDDVEERRATFWSLFFWET